MLIMSSKPLFSQYPIKICVITVFVLCALPFMTVFAQESVTVSSFLLKPTTTLQSLPSDILTGHQQSPRVLGVTNAASRGGTTSTVRPWPSHSFFRSVLSKSDNVVTKRRNRSNSTRRKNKRAEKSDNKNTTSAEQKGQDHPSEQLGSKYDEADKKASAANSNKFDQNKPIENISVSLEENENQLKSDGNSTRARSVVIAGVLVDETSRINSNKSSKAVSQRKFPLLSEPEQERKTMGKTENVTKFSQLENYTLKEMKELSHEYSYINSPQVGFQYEIAVQTPPTTTAASVPLIRQPTPYAVSTTLHVFSSKGNDDDGSENNRNTSNSTISAVTVHDTRRVTNDNAATTTPLPSGSQFEASEYAETGTGVAASLLPTTLLSSYNKSNEMILQNPQNTSSLLLSSPTHHQRLQLDILVEKGNGENITFNNNKSHLPHSLKDGEYLEKNMSEIHTQIIKNNPWTINHNSGNADMSNKASTFLSPPSTLSVNSLITLDLDTTRNFTAMPPFYISHASLHLPTHQKVSPTSSELQQKKGTSRFKIESANISFRKRISQNRKETIETNTGKPNYITTQKQDRYNMNQSNNTALINRRNMFTVVKGEILNPKISVESRNTTKSRIKSATGEANKKSSPIKSGLPEGNLIGTLLNDRTNQLERPSLTASILTGPDRMKDNDYFDEDNAQANLHHWIESEQGHFVTPSTELPRFTNLTWPYNLPTTSDANAHKNSQGNWATKTGDVGGNGNSAGAGASASTVLDVSINSKRKGKPNLDFNSEYEFYIPSAAADPNQNPILLAKRPNNKSGQVNYETWTHIHTMKPYLQNEKQQASEQSDHKSKIKHSHWGSKGLSMKPQNVNKPQTSGYEISTGNPKSSSSSIFSPTRSPGTTTFTIFRDKHQNHFLTSPSTLLSGTWPFEAGSGKVGGQSETASFVTAKTPTNIFYKPIINHFTATVPFNGTTVVHDNVNHQIFPNNAFGNGGGSISTTTTTQPSSSTQKIYVDEHNNDDDGTVFVNNKKDKAIPGKIQTGGNHEKNNKIIFKVWSLVDGSLLKLVNQREIPTWALQGYSIPASGTILNLKQIPSALRPLVTSAMNKETEDYSVNVTTSLPYVWKPLPILGDFNVATISSIVVTPTPPTTTTRTTLYNDGVVATSPITPDDSLFDNASNQIKYPSNNNKMGWEATKEVTHSKQPVSINYVLWNNPASIYGQQSIILSTPPPTTQIPLSRLPTPVSYFPSSTITLGENTPPPQYHQHHPTVVTIKHPGSSGGNPTYITTTTPRTGPNNMNQEKLELLFQNYFQYFMTTSTPAPKTTTTTTAHPISLANTVTQTYGQQSDNSKAWQDLQKLILRLATSNNNSDNKASDTPDNDKTEDLDYLGNVASIALIMSYLRNQYEHNGSSTATTNMPHFTSTTTPYGVTDDMTPPHKDQLWATVYPLFQHLLNNPNYTFIPPPPPPHPSNQPFLSETSSLLASMTPTSPGPIPLNEPVTASSNYFPQNNHYASYYPTITTPHSLPISHISITYVPRRGATTDTVKQHFPRSEETLDELGDSDYNAEETSTDKSKTLLLLKKLKKKGKKKKKLKKALLGAALLKKISGPLFGVVKKPKKYWLDFKFEIDFIEVLKKKLLYMLALNYMPVVFVLALGVTPILLSLVPLLYKIWWMKWKKQKYVKVKVPVPYPSPFPVPVYKHPPSPAHFYYNRHHPHGSHSPVHEQLERPEIRYNHNDEHQQNDDVIHIGSHTPMSSDHNNYALDKLGNGPEDNNSYERYTHESSKLPQHEIRGDHPARVVNSFNYDYARHSSTPNTHAGNNFQQYPYPHSQNEEIHVHLHDDESRMRPQFQQAPVTYSPADAYTSYTMKDLQPYPVTKSYQVGFDIGSTIAGITNKHDMEIFKILVETKKEKLSKLLELWNLAKYGASVASDAALNAIRGPTTPLYPGMHGKKKRKRRKRRKKRKHSNDLHVSSTINPNATIAPLE